MISSCAVFFPGCQTGAEEYSHSNTAEIRVRSPALRLSLSFEREFRWSNPHTNMRIVPGWTEWMHSDWMDLSRGLFTGGH